MRAPADADEPLAVLLLPGRLEGFEVFFPSRELSTDNAAMIAAAAYPRLLSRLFAGWNLNAEPVLPLA